MSTATSQSSMRALQTALERVPGGAEALRLMRNLGLWSTEGHKNAGERRPFPRTFSNLGPEQLSDLSAHIAAEAGLIFELLGLLNGIEAQHKIRVKQARAAARSRARAEWDGEKKAPTKSEIDDIAEDDLTVIDVEEQSALIGMLIAQATAAKEATIIHKEAVSREITYRGAQMKARLY